MNEKISLESLLSSYKFTEPVPPEIRKRMHASRKQTIVHILKKNRQYGIIPFLVLSLFFLARKTGITLSVMKATIAAWTAVILTTVTITGAAVYTVHYIVEKCSPVETDMRQPSVPAAVPVPQKQVTRETEKAPAIIYHVGILPFENIGVDSTIARKITTGIKAELASRLPGKRIAIFSSADTDTHIIKNMLMGSIIRFGEGYRITARIIDPVSSKIVLYTSTEIRSEDDIPAVCQSFSGNIAGKVR